MLSCSLNTISSGPLVLGNQLLIDYPGAQAAPAERRICMSIMIEQARSQARSICKPVRQGASPSTTVGTHALTSLEVCLFDQPADDGRSFRLLMCVPSCALRVVIPGLPLMQLVRP